MVNCGKMHVFFAHTAATVLTILTVDFQTTCAWWPLWIADGWKHFTPFPGGNSVTVTFVRHNMSFSPQRAAVCRNIWRRCCCIMPQKLTLDCKMQYNAQHCEVPLGHCNATQCTAAASLQPKMDDTDDGTTATEDGRSALFKTFWWPPQLHLSTLSLISNWSHTSAVSSWHTWLLAWTWCCIPGNWPCSFCQTQPDSPGTWQMAECFRIALYHDIYSLWSPYVIGQTIIFLPCSFFLPSFFFFPCLISAVGDWMSAILLHMAWP